MAYHNAGINTPDLYAESSTFWATWVHP
jgi:hypothetical protein